METPSTLLPQHRTFLKSLSSSKRISHKSSISSAVHCFSTITTPTSNNNDNNNETTAFSAWGREDTTSTGSSNTLPDSVGGSGGSLELTSVLGKDHILPADGIDEDGPNSAGSDASKTSLRPFYLEYVSAPLKKNFDTQETDDMDEEENECDNGGNDDKPPYSNHSSSQRRRRQWLPVSSHDHDRGDRFSNEKWRCWLAGICVSVMVAIFIAAVLELWVYDGNHGKNNIQTKKNSGGVQSCGSGDGGVDDNCDDVGNVNATVLGTCSDPIMRLQAKSAVQGMRNGAVASDHPVCSKLGTAILREHGGNAIDAAVTTALCLGVANPSSSGIGGGAFLLIHSDAVKDDEDKTGRKYGKPMPVPPFHDARHDGTDSLNQDDLLLQSSSGKITEVIDCREVAPQDAYRDMFLDSTNDRASVFGGLGVAVPGELKGLELAHARHGRVAWSKLVEPIVELARDGVEVNPNLAHEIEVVSKRFLGANTPLPEFLNPLRNFLTKDDDWNHPLQVGDVIRNPALANVLEAVMHNGSQALFSGQYAQDIADDIQKAGGTITAEELELYQPTLRNPLVAHDVFGFAVAGVPPPSSGGASVIGIARFLATLSIPLASFADTLSQHWLVEACRHVFAIRMSLSDPSFNTETVEEAVHDLVYGDYMKKLQSDSNPDQTLHSLSDYGGSKWAQIKPGQGSGGGGGGFTRNRKDRDLARAFGYLEDRGTSHFSVIDKDGNAVAMTSTVNTYFGSS